MAALDGLPPWATTGVGSLPFTDPAAAAAHAVGSYDVPFCPQLPRLEGDMISEWLGSDPGRCGWSPARDRERPLAWDAFLGELARRPPGHGLVKLQVTGPITLACALERRAGDRPDRAAALRLAAELSSWLAAAVRAQVGVLADRSLTAVVVVDEPALAVFGTAGADRSWDPLRAAAPAWGLHLCCAVPWDLVERAEPDLLSFDLASTRLDRRARLALERLLARDTRIAWGALAAHRAEGGATALRRVRSAVAQLPRAAELGLLTASCGTGRLAVARERAVSAALRGVAQRALDEHQRLGLGGGTEPERAVELVRVRGGQGPAA